MRSFALILTLTLPLIAATPALAGRWVTIADGTTRAVHLDTAGIQREGTQTRAWVREVHTQEQRSDQAGVLYYSTNTLTNYDCAQRTFAPLFRVFYGSDAMELRRIKLDAVEVPALVLPGSVNEQLLDKACEVVDTQAKAQAAKAKPAATPPGGASSPAGAQVSEAKANTPDASADKAGLAPKDEPNKDAKPGSDGKASQPTGEKAEVAGKQAPGKDSHAAPDSKSATVSAESGGKPLPAGVKPAPMPVAGGNGHGGAIQLPPIALARARAHGYAVPVNTAPSRPAKPKVKAKTEPDGHGPGKSDASKNAHAQVHWSYAGPGSPENWSKLDPENMLCGVGKRQSPIDIREGARLELEPVKFDYRPTPLRIVDNGHTIQVNYGEGSYITVAGERFELKQFHFHKPAEERIDGRWFDMVAHLVHKSMDGRLAVVAVLFEMRDQPNAFLRNVWPHLPLEPGREVMMHEVMIDATKLLPETRTYFTYMGSLTTPPCSEGVRWIVLKTPVEVSFDQVAVFSKLYSMNARPIQPSHGRLIKESM